MSTAAEWLDTPEKLRAWLDSDEGQEWSLPAAGTALREFAPPRTLAGFSPPVQLGPLDPAEDPCGRPPLGERDL